MAEVTGTFKIGSHNKITISGLQWKATGAYINNAQVTGTLKTHRDESVTGGSVTFDYVEGSDGEYEGLLGPTANMQSGRTYRLYAVAITSPGQANERQVTVLMERQAAYVTA